MKPGVAIELRGPVGQRFGEAFGLPVGGPPHQVLGDVETEGVREFLLLDSAEIEVGGRCDAALRERDAIVNRLHRAGAEHLAGHECCRNNRGRELLENRRAITPNTE